MSFEIHARDEGDWKVIDVRGELDAHTAPELDFQLAQLNLQGAYRMVLDLAAVDLVDSTGLGALVAVRNRCMEAGGDFAIANPRPIVLKVIHVTGLEDVLPVQG